MISISYTGFYRIPSFPCFPSSFQCSNKEYLYCKRETKRVRDNFIHVSITYQLGPVHLLEEFTAEKSVSKTPAKTVDEILEEIKPSNALMGLISSNSHVLLIH